MPHEMTAALTLLLALVSAIGVLWIALRLERVVGVAMMSALGRWTFRASASRRACVALSTRIVVIVGHLPRRSRRDLAFTGSLNRDPG